MVNLNDLHTEYIINEKGEKKSIILPISEFEALLEEIEDLVAITERKNEPNISHEQLIAELKEDDFLQDWMEKVGNKRVKKARPNNYL